MAKGERQKAKPSSAARAAELLGQGAPKPAFGFGGCGRARRPQLHTRRTPLLHEVNGKLCSDTQPVVASTKHILYLYRLVPPNVLCTLQGLGLPSAARLAARPGCGKRSCSSAPAPHARRFSGAQPLARPAEAAGDAGDPRAAEPALTPGDLDGELLQHLRRLSKRDPVTKLKALQARGAWRHRAGTPLLGGRKQAAPGKGLEGAAPLSWPVVLFACALVGAPIRRAQRALLRVAGRINHHGCLQLQAHTLGALLLEHTAARLLLHLTGGRNGRGW